MNDESEATTDPAPLEEVAAAAIETTYDPETDCVVANGVRVPADVFRDGPLRQVGSTFAMKPLEGGGWKLTPMAISVKLIELEPKRIEAPNAKPQVMLPSHVARQIAAQRGVAAQKQG